MERILKRVMSLGALFLAVVLLAQCGTEAEDGDVTSTPDDRAVLIAGGTMTVPAVAETTDGTAVVGSTKMVFFTGAAGLPLTGDDFAVTGGGAVDSVSVDGDKVTIVVTFPANTSLSPKIYNVVIASTSTVVRGDARVRIIHLGINGAGIDLPPALYVSSTGDDDNDGQPDRPFKTLAYAYAQAVSDPASKTIVVLTDIDAGDEAMVLNGSIAVNPPEITITSGTPRRMLTRTGNAASSETHVSPYFGPSVVRVEGGAKVVFQDIAITGGMIRGLGVYGGGNMVTLNNTEISGKASYGANSSTHIYGGGVLLSNSADPPSKITMNGGSIYGEDNLYGKDNVQLRIHGYGVAIKNDQYATDCTEFEMNGGTIYGKATTNEDFGAYSSGGGVYLYGGTFTMTDATIYGDGVHDGGGVYIRNGGSFTMYGASRVSGGVDSDVGNGGGVYLYDGTFTMNDYSTINGSSAYWIGGGVFIQCPYPSASFTSFTMNDHSTVSGNTAVQLGGGVYQAGNTSISSFKMNDDSAVSGNTAGERGGGVYLEDGIELWDLQPIEFEMHGNSVIYGSGEADETLQNTAPEGAAMYHKYHSTEDNRYDFEVLTPIETTLNAGNYLDWLEWE